MSGDQELYDPLLGLWPPLVDPPHHGRPAVLYRPSRQGAAMPDRHPARDNDLDDWSDDPPEPSEPSAWQRYEAHTNPDGSITCRAETNDDLDRGYPSAYASWELTWPDRASFLHGVGGSSRQGVGCQVTVTLDDRPLDRHGQPIERRRMGRRASDQP